MPANTFTPFLVNSNFCHTQEDCATLPAFLNNISGNTGNSYIAYAIYKILFGRVVPLPEIKNLWTWDFANQNELVEKINAEHSHVLFSLQDQIRLKLSYHIQPDWKRINQFLEKLKKPFVVFSLGANAFPGDEKDWYTHLQPEFVRFLHILAAHTTSLGVRGEETAAILRKLGILNVEAVGCPTYFEMGANRPALVKKPLTPYDRALGANPWARVLQDEKDLIDFLYFSNELSHAAHVTPAELFQTTQGQCRCFAGIEAWKEFVSHYAFSLFGRMHGGILAINSGVPSVITNADLRAQEMCTLFGIPLRPGLQPNEHIWRQIYEETDFSALNQRYPALYTRFMNWLAQQGLGEEVRSHAHAWATQQPPFKEPVLQINPQVFLQVWDNLYYYNFYIPTRVLKRKLLEKKIFPLLRKLGLRK